MLCMVYMCVYIYMYVFRKKRIVSAVFVCNKKKCVTNRVFVCVCVFALQKRPAALLKVY